MKLSLFLVLIGAFQLYAANTYSQSVSLSFALKNTTIEKVMDKIEHETEFSFLILDKQLETNKVVSVNANENSVEQILDNILKNTNIQYKIVDRQIILMHKLFLQGIDQNNNRKITGTITDEHGDPIIGANVMEKGTTNGSITDLDGNFTLTISSNANLQISYLGYIPQEVAVTSAAHYSISLQEDTHTLAEVVVVGYGTLAKKQVTSSITSISPKELVQGTGNISVANALQGKVAGLVISRGKDQAGINSQNQIQLRGVASLNSGKEPLVVIDGMPGGDIRSLLQEDILSIDVLKDASAGAIYGTRAAGGVILITTKKGQDTNGKVDVTYSGELTMLQDYGRPEVLSAKEFVEHGRGKDYGSDVDWYKELKRDNPISQRHVLTMSGGVKNAHVYASLYYSDGKGLALNDGRTDYGGRLNTDFKVMNGWLDIAIRGDYRQTKRILGRTNFAAAMRNNPTRSPYDPNSETGYDVWMFDPNENNALAESMLSRSEGLDQWFKPDINFKLNILPVEGLFYQQTIGFERRQYEEHFYRSMKHRAEKENNRRGEGKLGFDKTEQLSTEGYMTYIKALDKHSINAVAGYSYFEKNREYFNMTNYNFSVDDVAFWNMGEGTYINDGKASMSSNKAITEKLLAYFARANYSYDDKYMATATIRREGSSKFSDAHKWGNFWALSAGWRISNEAFMQRVEWINDLKLRVAYGVTGNNEFGADYSKITYSPDSSKWPVTGSGWISAFGKSTAPNPDLKWEEKVEWNLGLDFSMFDNRFYGKFDIYKRKVNDMLFEIDVPSPPSPSNKMFKNIGNLQNTGWELELGGNIVRSKDWNYSTNINLSHNETKILKMNSNSSIVSGHMHAPGNPGDAIRVEENMKIGSFYMWKFAGFDDDGDFLVYNKDGKVIPVAEKTQDDRRQIGNFTPSLVVGWNHNLSYKNFDLTVNLRSWINYDVLNMVDMYLALPNDKQNTNLLKKAYTKYAHIKGEKQLCDYFLEDGTFLKIDAINIGYNLNLKKYTKNMFSNARFYLTVTNVATFTGYGGVDPEVNINGIKDNGIEWLEISPNTRSYLLGVQLSF